MDARQFFEEVSRLRRLQKKYFKDRSSSSLTACKKQEKLIDDEIARVEKIMNEKKAVEQPCLFDREMMKQGVE